MSHKKNGGKRGVSEKNRAKKHFVRGVIARGEAVPEGSQLTPNATHDVVGNGRAPMVRRRRFSYA